LPVGRYWIDIIDPPNTLHPRIVGFEGWLDVNGLAGKTKLLRREELGSTLWSLDYSGTRRNWYLFEVFEPVEFPHDRGWGYPSIVQSPTAPNAPVVTSSADTLTRPPPQTASDALSELFSDAKGIVGIALLAYLFTRSS
jgi:hypothetical protein